MKSLLEILTAHPARQDPILFFYEDYQLTSSLTYLQISQSSQSIARELKRLYPKPTTILISLPTSPEFITCFFGVIRAGHIPVPLPPGDFQTTQEFRRSVKRIIKATESNIIIGSTQSISRLTSLPGIQTLTPQSLTATSIYSELSKLKEHDDLESAQNEICFIQFSSGSTQDPRGICVSHAAALANLDQIKKGLEVRLGDILCSWLPLYHDMGLIGGLLAPLYTNTPAHLMNPVDFVASPYQWLKFVGEKEASILIGPDFSYKMCTRKITGEQLSHLKLSRVRVALSGAEPVSAKSCREFTERFKSAGLRESALLPVYGLAENTLAVTFSQPHRKFVVDHLSQESLANGFAKTACKDEATVEIVSCGKPLDGVQLRILSAASVSLPDRQVGKIMIKTPSLTSGYYQNPLATLDLFEDGWLNTGDLGYISKGELFIIGREKDLIIINGKNYHPSDLELKAAQVQGFRVGRIAAVSATDPLTESEKPYLVIESKEISPKKRRQLQALIATNVSELVSLPSSHVFIVPPCRIERTSSGKVKRYVMAQQIVAGKLRTDQISFLLGLLQNRLLVFLIAIELIKGKLTRLISFSGTLGSKLMSFLNTIFRQESLSRALDLYLKELVSEITSLPVSSIDIRKPVTDYGMDSLGVSELCTKIEKSIVRVPLFKLLELNSVLKLREYLMSNHLNEVRSLIQCRQRSPSEVKFAP